MKRSCLLVLPVLAIACSSSVQPVAIRAGDICFRCRQSIVDTGYAAEIVDGGMHAIKFRTPGCLAQYLDEHQVELRAAFVTDYATKKMIRVDSASFVQVLLNDRTGERDYRAFREPDTARSFAAEIGEADLLDWADVLRARASSTSGD